MQPPPAPRRPLSKGGVGGSPLMGAWGSVTCDPRCEYTVPRCTPSHTIRPQAPGYQPPRHRQTPPSGFEIRSRSREKFRLSPFCITSSGKPSFLLGCVVRSEAVLYETDGAIGSSIIGDTRVHIYYISTNTTMLATALWIMPSKDVLLETVKYARPAR